METRLQLVTVCRLSNDWKSEEYQRKTIDVVTALGYKQSKNHAIFSHLLKICILY